MSDIRATEPEEAYKKRIGRYDHYWDMRTFSDARRKTSKPRPAPAKSRYALIVRRLIDERGRHTGDVIDIKSPQLLEILLSINDGVEGLNLGRSEPEISPQAMYYSYPGLLSRLKAAEKEPKDDGRMMLDIKAAIHVIEEDQGKILRDVQKLTTERKITFDLLWAIFRPNGFVYQHHAETNQDRILLGLRNGYDRRRDGVKYFEVHCNMIHDDGDHFGLARQNLVINEFRGERPLSDLDVCPLDCRPDRDALYSRAVELGKFFVSMPAHSYHEISGQAVRVDASGDLEKFYTSGRVMISPSAYRRFSDSNYNPGVRKPLARDSLMDDQYAIVTPVVFGFSFDRKSWGAFALSRLRPIDWDDDAFEALVLGDKQRNLIHALVREHVAASNQFDDVIKGKGRGLVGLLAGSPGCGKTLTAEAVAETTRRPLYAVSAGELGTTPEAVEGRLMRVLELAQMWDAVLLLDEAEVFLQRRSVSDVKRNALVSIFLRQLEYFQGILILTTNLPEHCDPAFESRIHFSVYYPMLDAAARRSIWSTFFVRAGISILDADLDRLSSYSINGREIKNAFSSATTIARANGSPQVTLQEIDVVLSVLKDWQLATRKQEIENGVVIV
ncbi:P-loop containing nucleoside triphosphate hydrolase protein [Daedalea quercina L-15889]|uniref:p-loop containing nucleoside triphosphate hydrolase protein n=1 Tax=Daedalea quercina L-15889 TaxID=1314783 RepID=A0A165SNF7_9APHY|nr:P-loop containing nucleoside triphosphate hydrolase protein [Daedalea quercina L-15889]